jgi:hypothetical protein
MFNPAGPVISDKVPAIDRLLTIPDNTFVEENPARHVIHAATLGLIIPEKVSP